ncbi:hypothetical protein QJQ45_003994 [Haematococcus lacustris]|nr:hypothetical protein QJQ45_003994 [Haematococcus lacustris]
MADDTEQVELLVKSVGKPDGFPLTVSLEASLADVQQLIAAAYPGNPSPAQQTDGPGPCCLHLVIKQAQSAPGPLDSAAKTAADGKEQGQVAPSSQSFSEEPVPVPVPVPVPSDQSQQSQDMPSHAGGEQPQAVSCIQDTVAALNLRHVFLTTSIADLMFMQVPLAQELPQQPGISTSTAMPTMPMMYFNPIVASAYQAAYFAALAAGMAVQSQHQLQQGSSTNSTTSVAAPATNLGVGPTGASTANGAHAAVSGAHSGQDSTAACNLALAAHMRQQMLASMAQQQMAHHTAAAGGYYGVHPPAYVMPQYPMTQAQQLQHLVQQVAYNKIQVQQLVQQLHESTELLQQKLVEMSSSPGEAAASSAAPHSQGGGAQQQNPEAVPHGVRLRRNAAAATVMAAVRDLQVRAHRAAAPQAPRIHRRQRVFTVRIGMRQLLQVLVCCMVLYQVRTKALVVQAVPHNSAAEERYAVLMHCLQHFTWRRLVVLALTALALWVTSLPPLRRFMERMQATQTPVPPAPGPHAPPQPGADPADPPAAAQAPAAGPPAGAAAGAAVPPPTPAAAAGNAHHRGLLREVAMFAIGFVTSLLPSWNHNPLDAAVFAAAQDGAMAPQQQLDQARRGVEGGNQPEGDGAAAPPPVVAG